MKTFYGMFFERNTLKKEQLNIGDELCNLPEKKKKEEITVHFSFQSAVNHTTTSTTCLHLFHVRNARQRADICKMKNLNIMCRKLP